MTERTIEFFWDVGSPYTYLAATQIDRVGRACGVPVHWRPFLLGGIFRETGNKPPIEVPAKGKYMLDDLNTWAAFYNVPFVFPAIFPVNSLVPMRAAVAADQLGKGKAFGRAIMHLYWAEGKDPGEPGNLEKVIDSLDVSADHITQMIQTPEIKETLKQNCQEAVNRGAFGAPTFFVGEKMFWGNDRLMVLEAYLKGQIDISG